VSKNGPAAMGIEHLLSRKDGVCILLALAADPRLAEAAELTLPGATLAAEQGVNRGRQILSLAELTLATHRAARMLEKAPPLEERGE
jgi:hypothetical protein